MGVIEGYLYLFVIPDPLISGSSSFYLFFGITMDLTCYDIVTDRRDITKLILDQ
jgi:hypothetical protein